MSSNIDATKPASPNAYTADMRANFQAAADEISALQDAMDAAEWLPLAGGTMLGVLTLAADPTGPLDAATYQFVENYLIGYAFPLSGGTMAGTLQLVPPRMGSAPAVLTLDGTQAIPPTSANMRMISAASGLSALEVQYDGVWAWQLQFGQTALSFARYDTAGNYQGQAFSIDRNTGDAQLAGALTVDALNLSDDQSLLSNVTGPAVNIMSTGIGGAWVYSSDGPGPTNTADVGMGTGNAQQGHSGAVYFYSGDSQQGATGILLIYSGASQSDSSGNIQIYSGNAGNQSGDISVQTGTGTTRGNITLDGGTVNVYADTVIISLPNVDPGQAGAWWSDPAADFAVKVSQG